jgi:hypothetical protein
MSNCGLTLPSRGCPKGCAFSAPLMSNVRRQTHSSMKFTQSTRTRAFTRSAAWSFSLLWFGYLVRVLAISQNWLTPSVASFIGVAFNLLFFVVIILVSASLASAYVDHKSATPAQSIKNETTPRSDTTAVLHMTSSEEKTTQGEKAAP